MSFYSNTVYYSYTLKTYTRHFIYLKQYFRSKPHAWHYYNNKITFAFKINRGALKRFLAPKEANILLGFFFFILCVYSPSETHPQTHFHMKLYFTNYTWNISSLLISFKMLMITEQSPSLMFSVLMPLAIGRSTSAHWEIYHCSWEAHHHCPLLSIRVSFLQDSRWKNKSMWLETPLLHQFTMPYFSPSLAFIDMTASGFFFPKWSNAIFLYL